MSHNSSPIQPIWYAKVNNTWLPALPHQVAAVNNFISTRNPRSSVPHPKGGLFEVTFSERIDNKNGSISTTYKTEYGNIVEMIYKKPSHTMANWGIDKSLPHELVPHTDVIYKPYDPSKPKSYGMTNWGGKMKMKMKRKSRKMKRKSRKSIKCRRSH